MKQTCALVLAACAAASLAACTPKPQSAEPIAERFVAALSEQDFEAAAELTDAPAQALADLQANFEGLQAEGVAASLGEIAAPTAQVAHAQYSLQWQLPRDREFAYDSQLTLSQSDKGWQVRWQPNTVFPSLGTGQHLQLRAIDATRASVVSADGATILQPGTQYRLLIDGRSPNLADIVRVVTAVVPDLNAATLERDAKAAGGNYSVTMLSEQQYNELKPQLNLPGITLNPEAAMINVDPEFAPEIMSRVEKVVADDIAGANGWKIVSVNENGAVIDAVEVHQPTPAPAIRVSLDHKMQQAAQEAVNLRAEMKAMLVAVRPSTGEILAVAQTPAADKDGDIALTGQFPPGSTFKMITATAGMQKQDLTPASIVPCPGTMEIGHRIVTNYNGFSKGNVPLRAAFAASCNTTFADISAKLTPGELEDVAKQFGLGLDFDVAGLSTLTGSVPVGEELVDRTEAGFGQGKDLASPFGMALVAATAAAGKTPMPQLISGHATKVNEEVAPPAAEDVAQLREMMRAVVTQGTARGMQAKGEIYGKTGEAEISGGSHAWFAGYRDDVAFATLIVLGGGSESAVAITDHFLRALD